MNTEKKYEIIFENSPVALLEEDFTEVKKNIARLQDSGIKNFDKYFDNDKSRINSFIKLIKLINVNKAALNLFEAKNKTDFKKNFNKTFLKDSPETFEKEVIAIAKNKKNFEAELVNKTLKNNKLFLYKKWVALPEKENSSSSVLVSVTDITSYKKPGIKNNHNEITYKSLFRDSIDGMYVSTLDGQYIDANPSLIKILGYENKKDLLSINIPKQLYVSEKDRPPPSKRSKPFETRLRKKDGSIIWVEISSKVIYKDGNPAYYEGIVRDITLRKKAENEIKYLSFHDKLTGLYNRTYFEEEIKRLDTKRQLPISIAIGDVNGLKIINDVFGHKKGDELLIKISKILKTCFRDDDIISRWGGDEFITILPCTALENASQIVDRIKEKCQEHSSRDLPVSISLGVSTKNNYDTEINKVIKESEDKMYKDKLTDRQDADNSVIYSLLKALDENKFEPEHHIARLRKNAIRLGNELDLPDDIINELDLLATIHDIGKIAISDMIIFKPGKLNNDEWEEMKRHSEVGYRIAQLYLKLSPIAKGILYHHEKWDGGGYPTGIKRNKIPLISRIISIVDAYDAMTNDRPYRKALNKKNAIVELKRNAGSQFDPHLVDKFINILKREEIN
ncbi:MAG: diguanylate cyclase [Actinomycetota bacterium]|nr:diguanylate cyclase [Actinomycetota bacterium]